MFQAITNFFKKKEKKENSSVAIPVYNDGLDETFLFDFKNYSSGYRGNSGYITVGNNPDMESPNVSQKVEEKTIKVQVKPKDVLHELETVPTPFNLVGLEDKINILKAKSDLITQHYAKREVTALIERLENRKQYVRFKSYFGDFQNTTDEKIDDLLMKHNLVMKTADIFIPEFPDDAIQTMTTYTKKLDLLCGKKPVFYVIAEPDKFRTAYEKRDPILLVQSPFGFYWQILGAWDETMILLGDL